MFSSIVSGKLCRSSWLPSFISLSPIVYQYYVGSHRLSVRRLPSGNYFHSCCVAGVTVWFYNKLPF